MTNDILSQVAALSSILKKHQTQGESVLDVLNKLAKHYETSPPQIPRAQPEPTATPPVEQKPMPQPVTPPTLDQKIPVYKFKTLPDMQNAMNGKYGNNWITLISPDPSLLHSIVGVCPDNATTQKEMHRIYAGGSDEALGTIDHHGKMLTFSRLMITPT